MGFDIPSDQIADYSVFSIRGGKKHPESIEKDALYDWGGKLPVYEQADVSDGGELSLFCSPLKGN
jgi:hypothetical protein